MVRFSRLASAAFAGSMLVIPASAQQPPATAAPAAPPAVVAPPVVVAAPATDAKPMAVGTVVQLRSGGPKMTIIEITATMANVQWYQESAGFKKDSFPLAALKVADADEDEDDEDDEDEE